MPMHYFKNYLVELNHILNKIDLKEFDTELSHNQQPRRAEN